MSALFSDTYRLDVLRHDYERDLRIALNHRRAAITRAMFARQAEAIGDNEQYQHFKAASKESRRRARSWLKGARWKRDELYWLELHQGVTLHA